MPCNRQAGKQNPTPRFKALHSFIHSFIPPSSSPAERRRSSTLAEQRYPERQEDLPSPSYPTRTSPACDVSTDELETKLVSVSSGTVDLILLSVMLVSTVVWRPRLSSLVALGYLTSVALCSYVITVDTYWSGRTPAFHISRPILFLPNPSWSFPHPSGPFLKSSYPDPSGYSY